MGDTGARQFDLHSAMEKDVGQNSVGPSQLIWIFRRRIWVLALTAGVVFLLVAFITATTTKMYTATAQVQIDTRETRVLGGIDSVVSGLPATAAAVDTETQILMSPALAGRVVDKLNLTADAEFNSGATKNEGPLAAITGLFGGDRAVNAQQAARERAVGRQRAIRSLLDRITVSRVGLTYIIEVSAKSASPEKSALLANTYSELYLTQQLENKYDTTARANEWLSNRLESLRQDVESKERAVETYRAQNGLLSAEGSTLTEQAISGLNTQLVTSRADLAEREARLRGVEIELSSGKSGDAATEALGSNTISNLRERQADIARTYAEMSTKYGPKHPEMKRVQEEQADIQRRIDAEVSRIVTSLRNEVEIARNRVSSIQASLGVQQNDLAANNVGAVKLRELERDAQASRTLYEAFLSRSKQIAEQSGIEQPDARIISRASTPFSPSSPNTKLNLAFGLLLGLALGALAALALEMVEQSLRTPQDVQDRLNVTCLGSLPYLDKRMRTIDQEIVPPESYVLHRPLSAFGEALRGVRASLFFSSPDRNVKVLAVTSALPDEGKTTTTLGLARISALAGSKTCIVDCDLRRRSATHALGLDVEKGLTEVLFKTATLDEVLQKDPGSGADVVPLAQAEFTPLDLFSSDAMRSLIDELRERYEVVILDTAPVLPLADTRVLSPLADTVLVVARWGRTPHSVVRSALDQLYAHGAHVAGAVLEGVDSGVVARLLYDRPDYYSELYQTYYIR